MLLSSRCGYGEGEALANKRVNLTALFSAMSLLPGAAARRTRINFTAPGCLATCHILALLSGLQVMRQPLCRAGKRMRNSETVDAIVALVDVDLEGATHQLRRMCGPQIKPAGIFARRTWRERADSRAVFADSTFFRCYSGA